MSIYFFVFVSKIFQKCFMFVKKAKIIVALYPKNKEYDIINLIL